MGVLMNHHLHHISHRLTHISMYDNRINGGVIHPKTLFPTLLSKNLKGKLGPLSFLANICLAPQYGFAYHPTNLRCGHINGRGL